MRVSSPVLPVLVSAVWWLFACSPHVAGTVELHVPGAASVSYAPDTCLSGAVEGFSGVTIARGAAPGLVLRFNQDAFAGPRLRYALETAGHLPLSGVVEPAQCRALSGSVSATATRINGVRVVEGQLAFDCTLADGQRLTGDVSFDTCWAGAHAIGSVKDLEQRISAQTSQLVASLPTPCEAGPKTPETLLPKELAGLSVKLTTRIVDGSRLRPADPMEVEECGHATLRALGFRRVPDNGPAAVPVVEVTCTRTADVSVVGSEVVLTLPQADAPGMRIVAEGQELFRSGQGPRRVRCPGSGTPNERAIACAKRMVECKARRLAVEMGSATALRNYAAARASSEPKWTPPGLPDPAAE